RTVPVPLGQGAVLRRAERRRPGGRARQPRRADRPRREPPPLHARPRAARRRVAERASRGALPRGAAPVRAHAGEPGTGPAPPLRPPAALDQPRGLLRQTRVLVLGRLLGPRRPAR